MTNKSLPYWLIAPAALFTVALFLYPLSLVTLEAFTAKSGGYSLENFQTMVGHWKFGTALKNTPHVDSACRALTDGSCAVVGAVVNPCEVGA